MDLNKHKNLMKAFITSKFSYCALIWMFHSSDLNKKINQTHELLDWFTRIIWAFLNLLIYTILSQCTKKSLQVLVTEVYKVKNEITPDIMKDVFEPQNPS